jgi:excisionase family DNA binding protein
MITADEAAELSGVSPRTIYRRVEATSLHFAETNEGRLLICTNSLTLDSGR